MTLQAERPPEQAQAKPPKPRTGKRRNQYLRLKFELFFKVLGSGKLSFRKLFNVVLCSVAYRLKIRKGSPAPYILSLELWNECNAGCLFCRDKKGKIHDINPDGPGISKGKMPAEMAMAIIEQLKNDSLVAVLYTNGEPLLYKDLGKVIQYATDRKLATVISSNGLLFTEDNAREIFKSGLDLIKIQLSGFTQDIYSVQIRYGQVERLKENIRMLARLKEEEGYKTIVMIDYILYNYNKHQLPLVREFCQELGFKMNIRPGNPFGGLEDLEPKQTSESLPLKISCDLLWKIMQVDYNGNIFPCCESVIWGGSKPYEVFKIGQTDVKGVWRGQEAYQMRDRMASKGRGSMAMCAQCTRKGVCFKW